MDRNDAKINSNDNFHFVFIFRMRSKLLKNKIILFKCFVTDLKKNAKRRIFK